MKLILAVALAGLAIASPNCSNNSANTKQLSQDEIDCGKSAIASETQQLIPVVTLALGVTDPAQRQAQLDAQEKIAGDALLCAVATVVRDVTRPAAAGTSGTAVASADTADAGTNAATGVNQGITASQARTTARVSSSPSPQTIAANGQSYLATKNKHPKL